MNGRGGRYLLNSLRQLEARDWLILGCVAAVALFLRWQRLDNPEFAYDQAWSLNRTWEFVHEGRFPFHGEISSHGVPHGPTEIFMLAPVVVISSAPEAATAYVGMLQVLAVILTYLIAVRHLGSTTALVASSLYAINPWTIYFARKLWPPSIMALPSALLLLSILEFVRSRRQRWLVAAGFFAGALAMAHPSGFLVLIAVCLITAQQWRHISISGVLLATMATLVPALPYLLYDAQQGFAFVRGYASVPAATAATLDLQGLELLLNMTSGADQLMKLQDAWLGGANLLAPLFFALITALMIAGSILWLPPLCRRIQSLANSADTQRVCLALFLWLVVPVLLTLRHGIELNQPYYVALWPAPFLAVGWAIQLLCSRLETAAPYRRRWIGIMALALLSLPYLSLQHLERSPAYEGNASTLSLLEASQVIADLESLSEAHGNPTVVVYANHDQWETLHYLARGRLSVSNVEGQSLYLPDRAESGLLFAFVADAADTPDGAAEPDLRPRLARAVGFVEVETPRNPAHSGNGPASYFYRGSYDGSGSLLAALPAGLELDLSNGLRLRSINLPSESSAVKPGSLTLEWRLPDEPASQQWTDYITFVQLRDPTGRLIASNDLALTQYRMLQRAGGSLLTAHQLPAPSADEHALATVNFGLYEKYSRQNATWRLAEGQSADHAQLGSLRIVPSVEHDGGTPVRGVVFSGLLELIGYSEPTWKGTVSERELSITTNWRSLKPTDANLTFSIQLLDSTGKLVGQTDSQPRNGALPTSALRDGELFTDTREVVLTSPQQGPLSIHIVVYNGETGERLATAQGSSYLLQVLP